MLVPLEKNLSNFIISGSRRGGLLAAACVFGVMDDAAHARGGPGRAIQLSACGGKLKYRPFPSRPRPGAIEEGGPLRGRLGIRPARGGLIYIRARASGRCAGLKCEAEALAQPCAAEAWRTIQCGIGTDIFSSSPGPRGAGPRALPPGGGCRGRPAAPALSPWAGCTRLAPQRLYEVALVLVKRLARPRNRECDPAQAVHESADELLPARARVEPLLQP